MTLPNKYNKKPVQIDAIQFDGKNSDDVLRFINSGEKKNGKYDEKENVILIETLEGTMKASVSDFVIKGVKGEFYPCKEDIFYQTYNRNDPLAPIKEKYLTETLPYNGGRYEKIKKFILDNLPNGFLQSLRELDSQYQKFIIAGGLFRAFLSNETPHDMDIFFPKCKAETLIINLYMLDPNWEDTGSSDNCRNFRNKNTGVEVDVVTSFHEEPYQLLETFDFVITKFAFVFNSWGDIEVIYHKKYFEDLYKKTLNYDFDDEEPDWSGIKQLQRVIKYSNYGYKLSKKSLLSFVRFLKATEEEDVESYVDGDSSYAFLDKGDENFDDIPF